MTTPNAAAGAIAQPAPPDLAPLLPVAAAAALEALALLLRPLLAHAIALVLTTAGWQPGQCSAAPSLPTAHRSEPEPAAVQPPAAALAQLPVCELRRLAREAGHRALARSGRRSDLLQALAA